MKPDVYTRSIKRALFKQSNSDFIARRLTADEMEFIARIRETGRVDHTLLSEMFKSTYIEGENDFWQNGRWEIEPGVERKIGPPTSQAEIRHRAALTQEAKRRRINRISLSIAQEQARREYNEEQGRIREERERRILQNMLADMEWEQAEILERATRAARVANTEDAPEPEAPKPKLDYRKPKGRREPYLFTDKRNRYIPEWKLAKHKNWISPDLLQEYRWRLEKAARKLEKLEGTISLIRWKLNRERKEQEKLEELRLRMTGERAITIIKQRIVEAIRGTARQWTITDLMDAADCSDRALVVRCADELAGGGYIGKKL